MDNPKAHINPIPPTNPTPPTKAESLTNPKSSSQEKPLANPNAQSQTKPPNNPKPKPPTNPKPKPPTKHNFPKSVSIATPKPTPNAKDSLYKPWVKDSFSDDDDYANDVCETKTVKKDIRFKHVSDGYVDLGFVGGIEDDAYNAYDPGADSDGANS
ncbi:extensin-like [Arachis duranensis]|uniref:Extensin-like n=1 Tax=Arachis duranensis TaxID=130453 RepID=A0A6P4C4Z9_ARADU|nr:extensin-like [Arachis duranensis]XP_025616679.1 extensin-like [Arachis hypogaea]